MIDPDPPIPPSAESDLPFEPNAEEGDELADAPAPDEAGLASLPERAHGVSPEEIDNIPRLPGVYIMVDAAGKTLYVGKAANLH
jgi:hypothetical protein